MPELPEVEACRQLVHRQAVGQIATEVQCEQDDIVFSEKCHQELENHLRGKTILNTGRKGKYMWMILEEPPHPIFHFGMTGGFFSPDEPSIQLESSPTKGENPWPPKYTKFYIRLSNGAQLAMVNKRRLGRIFLAGTPEKHDVIAKLGFDPLEAMPSLTIFTQLLKRKRGKLKSLLLNQTFAAGVGNWIADEVLYQAKLDPLRNGATLTSKEIEELHHSLNLVVHKAVEVNADKRLFPNTWIFHHRWKKEKNAKTHSGDAIEFVTIGGRTTAWVPKVQK